MSIQRSRKDIGDSICGGEDIFCGTVREVDQETIEEYIKNQGREAPADNFTIVP